VITPIVAIAILMGVFPNLFLRPIAPAVERMLNQVQRGSIQRLQAAHQPSAMSHEPSVMSRQP
jgi:NADH:ubiquinone oxidoreductase subunit 4 (subunit M)